MNTWQRSRNIIIQTMKQFDNTVTKVYNALAWIGLMGGGEPDVVTGLPPQPQQLAATLNEE
jgi:hypothetical protein